MREHCIKSLMIARKKKTGAYVHLRYFVRRTAVICQANHSRESRRPQHTCRRDLRCQRSCALDERFLRSARHQESALPSNVEELAIFCRGGLCDSTGSEALSRPCTHVCASGDSERATRHIRPASLRMVCTRCLSTV